LLFPEQTIAETVPTDGDHVFTRPEPFFGIKDEDPRVHYNISSSQCRCSVDAVSRYWWWTSIVFVP